MTGREKKYKCDICTYRTAYSKDLLDHIRRHTGEKPYKCSVCGKSFRKIYSCKRHEASHTGEKPHKCDVCQVRFTEKGSLAKHMRFHNGDERYKCTVCNKLCSQSSHLKAHIQKHMLDKPFKCLHCEKAFRSKESFKDHMLVHHNPEGHKRSYKCSTCGDMLATKRCLGRHVLLMHGEKLHECVICNKKFATKFSLKAHSKSHSDKKTRKHSNFGSKKNENQSPSKNFQCICQKNFSSKSALKRHMKQKHPEKDASFVDPLSTNASCETLCPTNVSAKECRPIDHVLKDPLEVNSSVKYGEESVITSGNDNGDCIQMANVEKMNSLPNLCLKQEICSGDEISDEFDDYEKMAKNTFAFEEQTYEPETKQRLKDEHDESSLEIMDTEFHTVYIKEESYDPSS